MDLKQGALFFAAAIAGAVVALPLLYLFATGVVNTELMLGPIVKLVM